MKSTKAMELMTENPVFVSSDATLREAAEKMRDIDCGVLPVGTEEKLKGIITDRDIVIRAIAKGKDPSKEMVRDYMTETARYCRENDTLEQAADEMRKHNVSRLLVKNNADKVTGILSFGCIMRGNENREEIARVIDHAIRKKVA